MFWNLAGLWRLYMLRTRRIIYDIMNCEEVSEVRNELAWKIIRRLDSIRGNGDATDHLSLDTWEWPQGVAMYAMGKLYQHTRDLQILRLMEEWYDGHLQRGLPGRNVNTTAPMIGMLMLYEEIGKEAYREPLTAWAEWVFADMPRTQEGGLQHITSDSENWQQLWDDTLYMTVLFLYKAGRLFGRPDWTAEAEYQTLLHIKYLTDPHTGLWFHGFSFEGRHHFARARWARGNGWFTAFAPDLLEMMPAGSSYRMVLEAYKLQCEALRLLQDKTGLWHTLLDEEESYLETSATAAIAYGMMKGLRMGLLDQSFSETATRAYQAVLNKVEEDGTVAGVSYGTPMGHELEFYRRIPLRPTAYGQGLAFLMMTEEPQ